jgi:hypothetical protein
MPSSENHPRENLIHLPDEPAEVATNRAVRADGAIHHRLALT